MHAEAIGEKTQHENFMAQALEEAKKSIYSGDGWPFGAIIVHNGQVVSSGHNTIYADLDPTAYSAINAIRSACKNLQTLNLSDCVMYTTSEPNPMCMTAIYMVKLKKLYCATSLQEAACFGFPGLRCKQAALDDFRRCGIKLTYMENQKGLDLFKEYKQYKINHYAE
jgi:guanine deaminase